MSTFRIKRLLLLLNLVQAVTEVINLHSTQKWCKDDIPKHAAHARTCTHTHTLFSRPKEPNKVNSCTPIPLSNVFHKQQLLVFSCSCSFLLTFVSQATNKILIISKAVLIVLKNVFFIIYHRKKNLCYSDKYAN